MSKRTLIYRARLAIPLTIAILIAPWLLPVVDAPPIANVPKVVQLPCELARAVSGGRGHSLQLPGDLPLHLRLRMRSEEHTSELQSLMCISYAVFCLKQKNTTPHTNNY